MRSIRPLFLIVATLLALISVSTGTAGAAPTDYGNGCTLFPDNQRATVESLRDRCHWDQLVQIYKASTPGTLPVGQKNGWVVRAPGNVIDVAGVAGALWQGKTLFTGTQGGYLINRTVAGDMIRADVHPAASLADNKPMWALDYAQSPAPWLYDEIREVSPGVWYGYSWWRREADAKTLLLSFIMA